MSNVTIPVENVFNYEKPCTIVSVEVMPSRFDGGSNWYKLWVQRPGKTEPEWVYVKYEEFVNQICPYADENSSIPAGPWVCYRKTRLDGDGSPVIWNGNKVKDLVFRLAIDNDGVVQDAVVDDCPF